MPGAPNEWESALSAAGVRDAFDGSHGEPDRDAVIDFLAFSPVNPSSIRSCLDTARNNARSVRTALTAEMWEAINGAWIELKRFDGDEDGPPGAQHLPRRRQGGLPPLRRLGLPDHAPERRLLLPPPRLLSRARRQHRPHPRREVSRAPARARPASAAASTTSSGPRSSARSRRSPPIAGSITTASSRG